jgi:hypothetical protein
MTRGYLDDLKIIDKAKERLRAAGVHETKVAELTADIDLAQDIVDAEESVINTIATEFPSQVASTYQQARASFDYIQPEPLYNFQGQIVDPKQTATTGEGYRTNEEGQILYNSGVIADPATGEVIYPNKPVKGSPLWLKQVRENWSVDKVKTWRKTLNKLGYSVEQKGGIDQPFLTGLRDYYAAKWANYGDEIPLEASPREKARDILDPAALKNRVTSDFRRIYADDPSEAELDEWTRVIRRETSHLLRKGYEPEQAVAGAEERYIRKFENDPQVKFVTEAEEDNTELRDSLLATFQSINAVI